MEQPQFSDASRLDLVCASLSCCRLQNDQDILDTSSVVGTKMTVPIGRARRQSLVSDDGAAAVGHAPAAAVGARPSSKSQNYLCT